MNILNICVRIDSKSGGGSVAALELARIFTSSNHDTDNWIVVDPSDGEKLSVEGLKAEFFTTSLGSHRFRYSRSLSRAIRNRIKQYDLVLLSGLYLFPNTYAAYYCRKQGVPYILLPYDSYNPEKIHHNSFQKSIYRWLFDDTLAHGAALIQAANEAERKQIISYFKSEDKVFVAAYGFNVEVFAKPQPPELFDKLVPWSSDNKKTILYLARISKTKGIETLIEAFIRCSNKSPDLRLLIVGPIWEQAYLNTLVSRYKTLIDRSLIHFTGMVSKEEKYACFQNSDIYVLPSYSENFGITVLEAVANGLVPIVTDSVPWEELQTSNAGYRVPTRDVDAIASAIENYFQLPESSQLLMKENAKILSNNFGYAAVSKLYSNAFEKAITLSYKK